MLKVNPVAHLVCEFRPLVCVHHHILTTSPVIVVNGNLLSYILFSNTERFLHRQLHWQSVCIPSCLSVYLKAFHRLISQDGILYGTSHHMVYARMSVGRRWSLEENKLRSALALIYTLMEYIIFLPFLKYAVIGLNEIQTFMFSKFLFHFILFFILFYSHCFRWLYGGYVVTW